MYERILIALDLEGVNNVEGVPYSGLSAGSDQWEIARRQAALEVNAAARALYEAGAKKVALWDGHGGGSNIDAADLDPRVELLICEAGRRRLYFIEDYDCICYFGYHAMEGTLGGVLAHTMSSVAVQYYKLNGSYIGEVDMDAYIAAEQGVPSVFFAAGDIACAQARRAVPDIVTVVTKRELERNRAVFRDNEELFAEIGREIVRAVSREAQTRKLTYPATVEKSFKRVEDAAKYLTKLTGYGICADHPEDEILGKDAHTVRATVHDIDAFIRCI